MKRITAMLLSLLLGKFFTPQTVGNYNHKRCFKSIKRLR